MLQLPDQAAIAAPAPARTSDLCFDAFIRPATDFLDFPGRQPSCPFPAWDPTAHRPAVAEPDFAAWAPLSDEEIARKADELAWRNDRGDFTGDYPGGPWADPDAAGPEYDPTPADLAAYDCAVLDEHRGCHCRMDVSRYEEFEADRWFDDEFGGDWHDAEAVRSARGPLNPVVGGHFA